MSDQSVFTIEQRLIACVWVHQKVVSKQTWAQIRFKFYEQFQITPPTRVTLKKWEKKAFSSGSVLDLPRVGRPITRLVHVERVVESVEHSPIKPSRKRSSELSIPRTTLRKIMIKDLKLKPYRPKFVNELSDSDRDRRRIVCQSLLNRFPTIEDQNNVMFSDECAIYLSSCRRNVHFWSKTNPHFYEEIQQNPPHVMIWAAISAKHLIGPYFFEGPVNQESYSHMIENWFLGELVMRDIQHEICFQQDGAPAHYAASVRELLDETLPGWIGRGSTTSEWAPRSPDLTTPDNSLWGLVKNEVSKQRYRTVEQLKTSIDNAFGMIRNNPSMLEKMSQRTWRKINFCAENNGIHTDIIN